MAAPKNRKSAKLPVQPKWLRWHTDNEPKLTSKQVELATEAVIGLIEGKLEPLADFLKEPCQIPWPIRCELIDLIEGTADETAFRLVMSKHPGLKRRSQGIQGRVKKRIRDLTISQFLEEHGALKPGQHESAVSAAMQEFRLSRSTIEEVWSSHLDSSHAGLLAGKGQLGILAVLSLENSSRSNHSQE